MYPSVALGVKGGLAAALAFYILLQEKIFLASLTSPESYAPVKRPHRQVHKKVHQNHRPIVFPAKSCKTPDGESGVCRALSQCAVYHHQLETLGSYECNLHHKTKGVCCPVEEVTSEMPYITTPSYQGDDYNKIALSTYDINQASEQALIQFRKRSRFTRRLVRRGIVAKPRTAVFWHAKIFKTHENIFLLSQNATLVLLTSLNLGERFSLSPDQASFGLTHYDVLNTIISGTCPSTPTCIGADKKYRTIDGSCNNLLNGNWGRVGVSLNRLQPSEYEDGLSSIRLAVDGKELPSTRLITTTMHPSRQRPYRNLTLMVMQWGQFLDHDITHSPISKGPTLADITCCEDGHFRDEKTTHPECFPIRIPANDSFYNEYHQVCMEFVRSMPGTRPGCSFGPREQINQISSYIDASGIYGSTKEEADDLRVFEMGLLKVTNYNGRYLLPQDREACPDSTNEHPCFKAGDSRVNEQLDLALLHTLWVRQHNAIAGRLAELNAQWNDEIIYQETRNIIAAQVQHITYNEFLPIVLGRKFMGLYGLIPQRKGYFNGYRNDIDATIFNSFSTSAYRFGHTLVTDSFEVFGTDSPFKSFNVSDVQFRPFALYRKGAIDSLLRGLTRQKSERFDRFFTEEITNKLFSLGQRFGLDLVSLNIQRGRDHGLPPYIRWREMCGLPAATKWSDLYDVINEKAVDKLKTIYDSIDDIDLYVGGISESPIADTILGPTFVCIIGKQFIHLKLGDRFFYENGPTTHSVNYKTEFTRKQLQEIRKTTLARIICDNSDNLKRIQPLAFMSVNKMNKRVSCKNTNKLPRTLLQYWKIVRKN